MKKNRNKINAIAKNGKRIRKDSLLFAEVAHEIADMVRETGSIFSHQKDGFLKVMLTDGDGKKVPVNIKHSTVQHWSKNNCITNDTGENFSDLIAQARLDFKAKRREALQDEMLTLAELNLHKVLAMKTKLPVISANGKMITNEKGKEIKREDAKLLKIQADTAMSIAERFDSRYQKTEKTENKHVVFSLSALRATVENKEKTDEE